MKIIAFAASNSTQSINKQLVGYAASLVEGAQTELLDLNDYELPMFGVDLEAKDGIPEAAKAFHQKLAQGDAIMISLAEHNGNFAAAFKNLLDWCSRIDRKVFHDKPMVLLATSPGQGGGKSVLSLAIQSMPRFGGDVKGSLSIPSFNDNFDMQNGKLTNPELNQQLLETVQRLIYGE